MGAGAKTVEYVEFALEALDDSIYDANATGGGSGTESGESGQSSGHHAYAFKFKSTYQTDTDNARSQAGNGSFNNNKKLFETLGAAQLVPFNFSGENNNPYVVQIYKDNGSGAAGDEIVLLANIDWQVDTYNGILFVQDFDSNQVPAFARAFVYIGDMVDSVISAGGSGGSGSSFFNETSNGFINTTGSVSFSGGEGTSHTTTTVGSDTFFFVSGSLSGDKKSVFGGHLAVSGTLSVNKNAAVGSQVHITSAGKVGIGTSTPAYKLSVGGSMEIGEYLYHRNDTDTFVRLQSDEITLSAGDKNMINLKEDGVNTQVLIMSGGAASSYDETTGNDVSFYVSGSVGSAKTNSKGTAVFGGDVVVSGSFVNSDISGSLTQLTDGTSYILSNGSISVTTQSNGSIILSAANSVFNEYIGEANGSNTRFTLDHTPTANKNVSVFVNGQLQMPATNITGAPFQDYSVTGSVIFFTTGSLPPQESLLVANYTTNQSIS